MKHVILLWLLLLSALAPLRAQSSAPDSLRQHLDYLVAPLDKTQLPAPFLEEYGRRLLPV
ncbi:hypothetical protein E5K00_13285 [Hymenobacter aquaticus]|uniref:Uncharacterized protein n=1 Tax=Hymenobacter aquaticus TaxID=1867101 RepID=A0A4Z0PXU5_9BACT|nr:hypothetical protein [Hymenobacter aquaticus]TGE21262.1 hypothetical protein E5K00_13285 [Hymenobacter aquaticus]